MSNPNNVVVVKGNLTRDPMVSYNGDSACARFSIATRRTTKNKDGNYDADFPNIVAWSKTAEFVEKNFHKGDAICVVGEIRTGSYTNKDGVKVYTTDVWADSVGFGGGRSSGNATNDNITTKNVKPELDMNIPEGVDEEMPF